MSAEKLIKYPRTFHLPWSPGLQSDDKAIKTLDGLRGEEVVVALKLDGENCTMVRDHVHARSLDSGNHPSRDWVKSLHGRIKHEIPNGWRICGENLFAEHSIHYSNLPSYFIVFNIWEEDKRLAWDDMVRYCKILGLKVVPVLWRGIFEEKIVRQLTEQLNPQTEEGVVIQVTRSISSSEWSTTSAKFVRAGHVQTDQFWMSKPVVPNGLAKTPEEINFKGKNVHV